MKKLLKKNKRTYKDKNKKLINTEMRSYRQRLSSINSLYKMNI